MGDKGMSKLDKILESLDRIEIRSRHEPEALNDQILERLDTLLDAVWIPADAHLSAASDCTPLGATQKAGVPVVDGTSTATELVAAPSQAISGLTILRKTSHPYNCDRPDDGIHGKLLDGQFKWQTELERRARSVCAESDRLAALLPSAQDVKTRSCSGDVGLDDNARLSAGGVDSGIATSPSDPKKSQGTRFQCLPAQQRGLCCWSAGAHGTRVERVGAGSGPSQSARSANLLQAGIATTRSGAQVGLSPTMRLP